MRPDRSFWFRADGDQVFVRTQDGQEYLLCSVKKSDQHSWAQYVAMRLNACEEIREAGLTTREMRAIAKVYNSTKEDTAN